MLFDSICKILSGPPNEKKLTEYCSSKNLTDNQCNIKKACRTFRSSFDNSLYLNDNENTTTETYVNTTVLNDNENVTAETYGNTTASNVIIGVLSVLPLTPGVVV